MARKSATLIASQAYVVELREIVQSLTDEIAQKDMIIEDIHAAEKRLIADLDKANERIADLETSASEHIVDNKLAGWAMLNKETELQRALGWIDHADCVPLGLSRVDIRSEPDAEDD